MSQVFLLHSATDEFKAAALKAWLAGNAWDVLPDFDPAEKSHDGHSWERALQEKATRCEAVVCLVSRAWLSSDRNRAEYELARRLNKRVFVALIEKLPIGDVPLYLKSSQPIVSLAPGDDNRQFRVTRSEAGPEQEISFSSEGLELLAGALRQVAADPRFFAWPPENEPRRAPFRGLESLESVDAGVFFGRNESLIEALDSLRAQGDTRNPGLFVILGPSGAGKSSFLRAGLWPRLARDERCFLPLPVIRPRQAAITGASGLVAALSDVFGKAGLEIPQKGIQDAVAIGAETLQQLLKDVAVRAAGAASGANPPRIVIAIDQAEELFCAEGVSEAQTLLTRLRDLVTMDDPAIIVVLAIRTDSYDRLKSAKPLQGLRQRIFALPPLTSGAYRSVIEGPIERFAQSGGRFDLEPGLKEALIADAENAGADGLPLLAFTLRRLYRVHGEAEPVTLADYARCGALPGSIDAALGRVFAAADADPHVPGNFEARLGLLRRGLVPWLAYVDVDTGTPRRRIARADQIPAEARPLIDLLVGEGLLTRELDEATGVSTLELAHDSLLRQWAQLRNWLEEEFEKIATLRNVRRAAREWDESGRPQAKAAHGRARLEEALLLYARPDFTALLALTDRAYLAACVEKEKSASEARKEWRSAQIKLEPEADKKPLRRAQDGPRPMRMISSIALACALVLSALAGSQWLTASDADVKPQPDHADSVGFTIDKGRRMALDLANALRKLPDASASLIAKLQSWAGKPKAPVVSNIANGVDERRRQSVALNKTVESSLAQGDAEGALAAAKQSVALMQALSASAPGNLGWKRDLSVSYEKLGDVEKAKGDLVAALKSYQDDRLIAEALSTSSPANIQWRWDLSVSYEKVGDVQLAQGDYVEALKSYREGLSIRESLSASDPANSDWQRDLAVSYEHIGDALARQDDVEHAIAAFERALTIYQGLARSHPSDTRWAAFSVAPQWRLAELDKSNARQHLVAALAALEPLAASNRLDANRRVWLELIRAQLSALDQFAAPAKGANVGSMEQRN